MTPSPTMTGNNIIWTKREINCIIRTGSIHERPLSVGSPAGNGDTIVDKSKDPFKIIDLSNKLNLLFNISEFYTDGGSLLKEVIVASVSNAMTVSVSLAQLITIDNEATRHLRPVEHPSSISSSDVVKIYSTSVYLIDEHSALLDKLQKELNDLKSLLEKSEAKATELAYWIPKSRLLRQICSWIALALCTGAAVTTLTPSSFGNPETLFLPIGICLTFTLMGPFTFTVWKFWDSLQMKKMSLLHKVADCIRIVLARVQTLNDYAESRKTATENFQALHDQSSLPVNIVAQRKAFGLMLDIIKDHSAQVTECVENIDNAVESVLKDAISYAI